MCEAVAGSFYDASCVSLGRPWYYRRSKETWRGRALPPCLGCGYEACAVFAGISWEASRGPLELSKPLGGRFGVLRASWGLLGTSWGPPGAP